MYTCAEKRESLMFSALRDNVYLNRWTLLAGVLEKSEYEAADMLPIVLPPFVEGDGFFAAGALFSWILAGWVTGISFLTSSRVLTFSAGASAFGLATIT